jgi:tryptophan synthase alpha chain
MKTDVSPRERLEEAFRAGRTAKRALLMPYLVTGYPDGDTFVALAQAAADAGADVLELGIPFSDPIMDGPVIQRASNAVLERGQRIAEALALVERAAAAASVPVVLMTYYNIVFRRGCEAFADQMARIGVSGVIVPDLVVEEAGEWCDACEKAGIAPVMIAAPTSPPERLRALADRSQGFVYAASTLGVTGLRATLSDRARTLVASLRAITTKPLAVGIGVSTAEHTREVADYADGVIVGTAMVKATEDNPSDPAAAVGALVRELRAASGRG